MTVRSIGEAARDGLTSGLRAEVLASVSQAIYFCVGGDELYWITSQASPMHRRGLQVASELPELEAGSVLDIRDGMLAAGARTVLDFSASPVWSVSLLPSAEPVALSSLPGLILMLYRHLMDYRAPVGLGILIADILQILGVRNVKVENNPENISLRAGRPAVEGIVRAGLAHEFPLILDHVRHLVGLGEGLTPSGDDFLGGFFFCIRLLCCTYPDALDLPGWNYSDFVLACMPLTNPISFCLLKDHACGHALEPLHLLAHALLSGAPVDRILPHALELVAVGHSTGWNILTGFLAGMTVIFPR